MIEPTQHFVIVLGCQRSGTTLTGQIMGAHENALLIDEFDGLYPWFHALADEAPEAVALNDEVMAKAALKYKDTSGRFQQRADTAVPLKHVTHMVLKAPNLTFNAAKISNLEQPVSILYPRRDPRAVVASMLRLANIDFVDNQIRHLQGAPDLQDMFASDYAVMCDETQPYWIRAAKVWKVKSGLLDVFRDRGLRVLPFLYENLVAEPDDVIPELLAFCGLRDSVQAMNPQTVYQGEGPGGTQRTRRIDTIGVDRWEQDLSTSQIHDILEAAGPVAVALGYV